MDSSLPIQLIDNPFPHGDFLISNQFDVSIPFVLNKPVKDPIYLNYKLTDIHGTEYTSDTYTVEKGNEGKLTVAFSVSLTNDEIPLSGDYKQTITAWVLNYKQPQILLEEESDSISLFHQIDKFEAFDFNKWEIRQEFPLGRSILHKSQVSHITEKGKVAILLDETELRGGEFRTVEKYQAGSFRTSMKVANAPGSITGFFLYAPPDYYNEVDIEIFNDSTGTIMYTMYKDGKERYHKKANLGFDPTVAFHEYRFDVYEDQVAFYVDGELQEKWMTTTEYEPMQLMINSWYPSWLSPEQIHSGETLIDWVKY
ncbi:MAG: glycoside hydrolase family 16 protein [Bacillus sp. (in: Bacteria)]|nr:glycoside hydrolase family 16 protein [Bacillus sp. (in: firmicutes)]